MNLKQGDTWRPDVVIKESGQAKNCTNHFCKMIIVKRNTSEVVKNLNIVWDDQSTGIGYFILTHTESKAMSVGAYNFEVYLYIDLTFFKSIKTGILEILPTLKNDIV
jgi:hypothetical protein